MEVSEVLFSFTKEFDENFFFLLFFLKKLENSVMMFSNVGT